MTDTPDPTRELWDSVLVILHADDRVTPQLQGFLNLVEPKGVLAGTLYLEVPNELTRGMLDQRIRVPLLNAISTIDGEHGITNFAIVVNPEIQHAGIGPTSEPSPLPGDRRRATRGACRPPGPAVDRQPRCEPPQEEGGHGCDLTPLTCHVQHASLGTG